MTKLLKKCIFTNKHNEIIVTQNVKREYTEVCYPVTKEFREQLYGEIIKKNSELKSREIDGEGFEKMRELGNEKLPFR